MPKESMRTFEAGSEPEKTRVELPSDIRSLRESMEGVKVNIAAMHVEGLVQKLNRVQETHRKLRELNMPTGPLAENEHQQEVNEIKAQIRTELNSALPYLKIRAEQVKEFDSRAETLGSTEREKRFFDHYIHMLRGGAEKVGIIEKFEQALSGELSEEEIN